MYICNIYGHSLLGDTLYGNESLFIDRQALHAHRVSFMHPITKQEVQYIAPLPEDMQNLIVKNKAQ